jgi:uncharacterized membrane protein
MPVKNNKIKDQDIEKNRTIASLSYFGLLCLIPLFGKRHSKFVQFHAKQGLALFGLEVLCMLVYWVPLFGWMLAILFLTLSIVGIMKTLDGEYWKIPYIYEWSKKINL